MGNPQLSMGVAGPGIEMHEKRPSIQGAVVPIILDDQFRALELQSRRQGGNSSQQSGDDK